MSVQLLYMYGINRYMLGCKYVIQVTLVVTSVGINRYMLGCKLAKPYTLAGNTIGINRYMLGCKCKLEMLKNYCQNEN